MTLDITAYKNIKKTKTPHDEITSDHWFGNWFSAWVNPDFPGRADDIEHGAVYIYDDCTEHDVGYAKHYWWRNKLAKMAGYPVAKADMGYCEAKNHLAGACQADGGPFYELINFSDVEGVIGTEVSKKLLADFIRFEEDSEMLGGEFSTIYQCWKAAFEMASENGCVRFH